MRTSQRPEPCPSVDRFTPRLGPIQSNSAFGAAMGRWPYPCLLVLCIFVLAWPARGAAPHPAPAPPLPPTLQSLYVAGLNPLVVGVSLQFTATGFYSDGSTQDLTTTASWTSTTPGFATVGINTGIVTALNPGSTNITATVGAVQGVETLDVVTGTLQSLAVAPSPLAVAAGTTYQLFAAATFSTGFSLVQNEASWISSNSSIATVNPNTGLVTGVLAGGPVTITASLSGLHSMTSLTVLPAQPNWTLTGNLFHARLGQTATLLNNGLVLLTGGNDESGAQGIALAELYNPATDTFAATGNMTVQREGHTATLLTNGKVLIAGGKSGGDDSFALNTAEIYDPSTGAFTATGNMTASRSNHTATLLGNGLVLIVGGVSTFGNFLASAETYDPVAGTFTATGNMIVARSYHVATALNNGQVLVAGGETGSDNSPAVTSSAELYDTSSSTFGAAGAMASPRVLQTATLLKNGKVLVAGGTSNPTSDTTIPFIVPAAAELFDPVSNTFSSTGVLNDPRADHAATLLPSGMVLIAGGGNASGLLLATSELYDPSAGTFAFTANLHQERQAFTATLLSSGTVLAAGGQGFFQDVAPAEIYTPTAGTGPTLVSIAITPSSPSVAQGLTTQLTATGTFSDTSTQNLTTQVNWASASMSFATIGLNTGIATGVAPGTSQITAALGAVTSPGVTLTVTAAPAVATTLTYNGSTAFTNGGAASPSAVLTQTTGGTAVAGVSILFTLGSGGTAQTCSGTTASNGTATCMIPIVSQPVGSDTISASFAGNSGFLASNAGPIMATVSGVSPIASTLVYNGPTAFMKDGSANLAALLTQTTGGTPVVGVSVMFTLGTGGSAQTCSGTTASNGTATCVISSANQLAGADTISASFAGNSSFLASLAGPIAVTIADFAVSSPTGTQTVSPGSSATFTINAASIDGTFSGSITLSASGLPAGSSASFVPPSVSPGTGSTMMVTSTACTELSAAQKLPFVPGTFPFKSAFPSRESLILLGLLLACFAGIAAHKPLRRFAPPAALLLLIVAAGYLAGCNGGFPLEPKTPSCTATPAGTSAITVIGTSGADTHSTTVMLTVE